jgi:uncharacterized protein YecT (DUF1311 family)
VSRTLVSTILVATSLLAGFDAATAQTVTDGERAAYRQQVARYLDQFYGFLDRADAVWDREMAREKSGDCPPSMSNMEYSVCMGKEVEVSKNNLREYSGMFREIFFLKPPPIPGLGGPISGPTGTPPTKEEMVTRFDHIEANWQKYQAAMCDLATDKTRGGTMASYVGSVCELKLIRNHMRELGGILGDAFHR